MSRQLTSGKKGLGTSKQKKKEDLDLGRRARKKRRKIRGGGGNPGCTVSSFRVAPQKKEVKKDEGDGGGKGR